MGGGNVAKDHPIEYILASGVAATINYPLWRASAIGQSGFHVQGHHHIITIGRRGWHIPSIFGPYVYAFKPPYKGMLATVSGMTWARAAIFWGSDYGRSVLRTDFQCNETVSSVLPPLIVSTIVQFVNQPLVRSTITIQDPKSTIPNVTSAMKHIYETYGIRGLWHGTSAGVLKTVPKYCTAVIVKNAMEDYLPIIDHNNNPNYHINNLWRSAYKSIIAGIAGAVLTNPFDVVRNEMFQTNQSLYNASLSIYNKLGIRFVIRGMDKNIIAVSIPLTCTVFFTDAFIQYTNSLSTKSK